VAGTCFLKQLRNSVKVTQALKARPTAIGTAKTTEPAFNTQLISFRSRIFRIIAVWHVSSFNTKYYNFETIMGHAERASKQKMEGNDALMKKLCLLVLLVVTGIGAVKLLAGGPPPKPAPTPVPAPATNSVPISPI
jgi:hypothetical protein